MNGALHLAPSHLGVGPHFGYPKTERAVEPAKPKRRCVVCSAWLASDNSGDRCTCHSYDEALVPEFAAALAEGVDGPTLDELARSITGERAPNAHELHRRNVGRNDEWKRLVEDENWTFRAVAEEYNVKLSTVKEAVRQLRIRDGLKEEREKQAREIQSRDARIYFLLRNGSSASAIAEECNLSTSSVYKRAETHRRRIGLPSIT